MAWYKPGRNPNHPGDPPPKWAPLSKTTRLALVVTVIAGVVIALLIVATRSAQATDGADAAMDQPTAVSPASSGQRVEMPWAGVAVTFPKDWHVIVTPEELPRTRAGRLMGPTIPIFPVLAVGIDPEYRQRQEQCDLVTFDLIPRWQPLPLTTYDIAFSLAELLLPEGGFGTEQISLPRGDATHLGQQTRRSGSEVFHSVFVFARDPGYVWLWCTSLDESPADDWLSIAQTIEFLPEEA